MAGIEKKDGNGGGKKGRMICQQTDGEELGRTGIHEQCHAKSPGQTIAGLTQQNAKTDTQKQISRHNGNRIQENGFQRFFVHDITSF